MDTTVLFPQLLDEAELVEKIKEVGHLLDQYRTVHPSAVIISTCY